ncbi:MAG: tRNA pseudouridine(38-40) synthase TruA [Pseudomonadales bacterium]|jgi:tRNA pseudouridine38-40 synthase|nr:tRNA pseudouridine(38-40) synthase TruA [Pseudomonadales bacterium]
MTRWVLGIEYDGSCFGGFQRQAHATRPTVQGVLERVLSRIADHEVTVQCAGRTDAGVHATGQVVHFDTTSERPDRAWLQGGNSLLEPGIAIHWARPLSEDFHARFSAQWRRYRYLMTDRAPRQALLRDRVATVRGRLDAQRMHAAAQALVGEQDFSAFRAAGCQSRHAVREVQAVSVVRAGPLVCVDIRANAFLQHMVRNITGSLIRIGQGRAEEGWIGELLAARDRTLAGDAAPPEGLYLVEVGYAPAWGLPAATGAGLPMPSALLGDAGAVRT